MLRYLQCWSDFATFLLSKFHQKCAVLLMVFFSPLFLPNRWLHFYFLRISAHRLKIFFSSDVCKMSVSLLVYQVITTVSLPFYFLLVLIVNEFWSGPIFFSFYFFFPKPKALFSSSQKRRQTLDIFCPLWLLEITFSFRFSLFGIISVNEAGCQDHKIQIAQFSLTDIVQKVNKLTKKAFCG